MSAGQQTTATLDEFLATLKRRKILWEMHIATVNEDSANSTAAKVTIDGDTLPIPVDTIIGNVIQGQRVIVIFVPPSGYYIVGNVDGTGVVMSGIVAYVAIPSNSSAITTKTTVMSTPPGIFLNGHSYEVSYGWGAQVSVLGGRADFTAEQDSTGTQIGEFGAIIPGAASVNVTANGTAVFSNRSGHTITDVLNLTLTESGTAGTVTQVGTSARPRWFMVKDIGVAYPGSISLS